jgi:mRNA-degrading endonuclease RelE of RelBE toxin-antitoxin system
LQSLLYRLLRDRDLMALVVKLSSGYLHKNISMYSIEYTEEALKDLEYFRKPEQQLILDEVDLQLTYQPTTETNNRKRLRPNSVAEWELRIGKYRVFYDVREEATPEIVKIVRIEAVGFKEHNKVYIRGKEFKL